MHLYNTHPNEENFSINFAYQFTFTVGLIVGAIIRYAGTTTPVIHLNVQADDDARFNQSLPPDTLWLKVSINFVPEFWNN